MLTVPTTGRRSIFRGKDKLRPIRAILTAIGHVAFGRAHKDLARMVKMPIDDVSITDAIEWCIRGRPQLTQNEDGTYRVASDCRCGTRSYPQIDPACARHRAPSVEPKP